MKTKKCRVNSQFRICVLFRATKHLICIVHFLRNYLGCRNGNVRACLKPGLARFEQNLSRTCFNCSSRILINDGNALCKMWRINKMHRCRLSRLHHRALHIAFILLHNGICITLFPSFLSLLSSPFCIHTEVRELMLHTYVFGNYHKNNYFCSLHDGKMSFFTHLSKIRVLVLLLFVKCILTSKRIVKRKNSCTFMHSLT